MTLIDDLMLLPRQNQGDFGGSAKDRWPVFNDKFGPAASYIRRGSGEMNRLATRVRPEAQGKQISETKGSLNVEPIVRLQADANCECRRGKTL